MQFSHTEQWVTDVFSLSLFSFLNLVDTQQYVTHIDGAVGEQVAPPGTHAQIKEGKTLVFF